MRGKEGGREGREENNKRRSFENECGCVRHILLS